MGFIAVNGSINKQELDIPHLEPDTYLSSFFKKRDFFYDKNWNEEELESLTTKLSNDNIPNNSGYIETISSLKLCLINRYPQKDLLIKKLQKKIAVFGRIVDKYSLEFKKQSEIDNNCDIYSLAAIVFFIQYRDKEDYNSLNSAIKLCDIACTLDVKFSNFFSIAINFEQHLLRGLYESH
jgi:hypothetical protein